MEQVERWANFVKNNPKKWKKAHSSFISSQFRKHEAFIKRLMKESGGFEKILSLYGIKNIQEYRKILNSYK